jgi:hypothetical protein
MAPMRIQEEPTPWSVEDLGRSFTEKGLESPDFAPYGQKTDYSRWRLLDERGRQTWEYLESSEAAQKWPQSTADKYHLGLATVRF